jgi:Tfp pilus assembly protein PilF
LNKKLTRKEKHAAHPQGPSRRQIEQQQSAVSRLRRLLGIIVAVAGMLVYANTVGNEYVLDDWGLIPENKLTRRGVEGIGEIFRTSYRTGMDVADNTLYRPFSKATFAVEWEIAPNSPSLGHVDNILLYGLLCYLLFVTLTRLFKERLEIPFITVLLFALHPLHTEVVANIKSRDEILALIFLLMALRSALAYGADGKGSRLIGLSAWFFLAMLSKESSITWIAVLPLVLYFFTDAARGKYLPVALAATLPSILFILIRANILGNQPESIPVVDNYMAGIPDFLTQRTSAIAIVGLYFFKLFIPYPLVSDGSYSHFPPYPVGDWHFLLSFLIFSGLVFFAVRRFRSKDPLSFAILFFFITLSIASNVVIMIGTNYAERLLFVPSMGWCLAVSILLTRLFRTASDSANGAASFFRTVSRPLAVAAAVGIVFSGVAFARNKDWKDNYTLYMTDIRKVPESAHMRFYLANHISSEEFLAERDSSSAARYQQEAIAQLDTAIRVYPKYSEAYQRRGFIHFKISEALHNRAVKDSAALPEALKADSLSEADFRKSLEQNPSDAVAHNNYGSLLFNVGRFPEAREHFELAVRYNTRYAHAMNNLASVYGVFGEGEQRASVNDPANRSQHLLNAKQNFETAAGYFRKAIEIDPEYAMPYYLLGMTYRNLGDEQTAQSYFAKSEEVKKIKRYNASN